MCMKITDGRKLKHDVLEAIRIRAVQQVERGESPEVVIKALGMTRGCIYKWIAKYREGGIEALKAKPLEGRPLTLTGQQLRWIFKAITTKNPLLAKKEKAEIYFEDEAGIRSDYHRGTTWGIKGETPIIRTTGARFGLNRISAISAQGKMRFMTYNGKVNATVFCEFLKRLLHTKFESLVVYL